MYVRMYVCMYTNTSHSHAATHIHLYSVCIVKAHGLIDKAIIIKLTTSCYINRYLVIKDRPQLIQSPLDDFP